MFVFSLVSVTYKELLVLEEDTYRERNVMKTSDTIIWLCTWTYSMNRGAVKSRVWSRLIRAPQFRDSITRQSAIYCSANWSNNACPTLALHSSLRQTPTHIVNLNYISPLYSSLLLSSFHSWTMFDCWVYCSKTNWSLTT